MSAALASVLSWVHIATAVVGIGGAAFSVLLLRPTAFSVLEPPLAQKLMGAVAMKFRWVIWTAIVLFVITGVWLAIGYRGINSVGQLTASHTEERSL